MAPQRVVQPQLDRWCPPLRPAHTRHRAIGLIPRVRAHHLASTHAIHAQAQGPPPLPRGPTGPPPLPPGPSGPPTLPTRPPTVGPPLTTPVRPLDVTVYYRADWPQALLHGSIYGGEWTNHPMHAVRFYYRMLFSVHTIARKRWRACGGTRPCSQCPASPPLASPKGPCWSLCSQTGRTSGTSPPRATLSQTPRAPTAWWTGRCALWRASR